MVSVMWLCSGLKATFLVAGNLSKSIKLVLQRRPLSVEFLKDPSNPNYLENVLNNELLNIDVWLRCNKLSINVQKTNYVIFRPSQRKVNHSFLSPLEVNL